MLTFCIFSASLFGLRMGMAFVPDCDPDRAKIEAVYLELEKQIQPGCATTLVAYENSTSSVLTDG